MIIRSVTLLIVFILLAILWGCKQTQEERFQRYLEEVADSSSTIEFVTPSEDSEATQTEIGEDDSFADDEGIYTIPDIPQQREVDMNANSYELEKMMRGAE